MTGARKVRSGIIALAALVATLGGCALLYPTQTSTPRVSYPPVQPVAVPPAPPAVPSAPPIPPVSRAKPPVHHSKSATAEKVPQSVVTLAGEPSDPDAPGRIMERTSRKLAQVDRSRLTTQEATAYDQVQNFLNAGRQALEHKDYLTATGYAKKAWVLVNKLPSTTKP